MKTQDVLKRVDLALAEIDDPIGGDLFRWTSGEEGIRCTPFPRPPTPPALFQKIAEAAGGVPKATLDAVKKEASTYAATWAQFMAVANREPKHMQADHLRQLSAAIAEGREIRSLDGWSVDELAADRSSKLDALRKLLTESTQRLHRLARPFLERCAEASKKLAVAELRREREHLAEFGLVLDGAPVVVRGLAFAHWQIRQRFEYDPLSYSTPEDLLLGLVPGL